MGDANIRIPTPFTLLPFTLYPFPLPVEKVYRFYMYSDTVLSRKENHAIEGVLTKTKGPKVSKAMNSALSPCNEDTNILDADTNIFDAVYN